MALPRIYVQIGAALLLIALFLAAIAEKFIYREDIRRFYAELEAGNPLGYSALMLSFSIGFVIWVHFDWRRGKEVDWWDKFRFVVACFGIIYFGFKLVGALMYGT